MGCIFWLSVCGRCYFYISREVAFRVALVLIGV